MAAVEYQKNIRFGGFQDTLGVVPSDVIPRIFCPPSLFLAPIYVR